MSDYSIALSGLNAAQSALSTVGNNIANAATEGYHRQRVSLTPAYSVQQGSTLIGGGVNVANVVRLMDGLLDTEINRQQSALSQTSQECTTLQTIENVFGESLSEDSGLSAAIDKFFNSLQDLTLHPAESTWQNQTVSSAETLANTFRSIGDFLSELDDQLRKQIDSTVETINTLSEQIANLNENIQRIEIAGDSASNLSDARDNYIAQMSELAGTQKQDAEYGMVNVTIGSMSVVLGSSAFEITAGTNENGDYGIAIGDSSEYITDITGGKLAALINLKNNILPEIAGSFDTLAQTIIQKVNDIHIQGCGDFGSFTELTGGVMDAGKLENISSGITDGNFYIRIIKTDTGEVVRESVAVDASVDTMATIAGKIALIANLDADVADGKLVIQADSGYKFDFMPAVLPEAEDIDFNSSSPVPSVSVSGVFNGDANDDLTFTVVGSGDVSNGNLQLVVKNGSNQAIANLNIGSGYVAGSKLNVGNGIYVALSSGNLVADDSFKVNVFADTDTSGFLASAGMNTFFSGTSASDMKVCDDIIERPDKIATASGGDFSDNSIIMKLAAMNDEEFTELDNLSFGEYYSKMVTGIGQDITTSQTKQASLELVVQNLTNRQSEISGVDVNQEAAQMLVFEQMYQAMAKYLATQQALMTTLMDAV
jgi:flagellar hook-associated protein FlgK